MDGNLLVYTRKLRPWVDYIIFRNSGMRQFLIKEGKNDYVFFSIRTQIFLGSLARVLISFSGCRVSRHNDSQHNGSQQKDNQHNGSQHNGSQYNGSPHNGSQHNDNQHNDNQCNGSQHKDSQHNGSQYNDS